MKFLRINSRHNDIYFTLQFSRKQRKKKEINNQKCFLCLARRKCSESLCTQEARWYRFHIFHDLVEYFILFYFIFSFFGLSRNIEGEKCKYKSFLLRHRCCILSTRSDFKRIIIFIKEPDEVLNITKQSIMITDFFWRLLLFMLL